MMKMENHFSKISAVIQFLLKRTFCNLKRLCEFLCNEIRILRDEITGLPETKKYCLGGFEIWLPYDHALPDIIKMYPDYASNLARLAKFLGKESMIIDVGANVGDSVVQIKSAVDCSIVCIEGHSVLFNFLKNNIKQFSNVSAFQYLLGEESKTIADKLESDDRGTAKLVIHDDSNVNIISLDDFMKMNPAFQSSRLLKIDTDGYDLKIIKGGMNYLEQWKPVLFFEYSRTHLSEVGDDGLSSLWNLRKIDYDRIIYYDNFGRFILSTNLKNEDLMRQLYRYSGVGVSAISYYDICLFHSEDSYLASQYIENETNILMRGTS